MNRFPIQKPANVALLTSFLDQHGLSQIHQQLIAGKASLTLPLITIYPASCDVAISGVDLALDGLARSVEPTVDEERLMSIFHMWKHMLDLNIIVASSALRSARNAQVKSDELGTAIFFLEHLYDPCERASVTYYSYLHIADLLLAFKMNPVLIDLALKKWVLKVSVDITTARSACMFDCLTSGGKRWLVLKTDALYDIYRAAAVRFFDELSLCCHKDSSLIVKHVDRSVLETVLHYELDPVCVKLLDILRCATLPPAALFKVIEKIYNAYKFTSLADQTPTSQAWIDLKSLLPQMKHWDIALMGIGDALKALAADLSEERCMAVLQTWKLLLKWGIPVASSVPLIQTTASLLVTMFDGTVVDAALFFVKHLYKPTEAWPTFPPACFDLQTLLSYHNMHPPLIRAFLNKWRACTDIAFIEIKCACLYHALFATFERSDEGAEASFADYDNPLYSNYHNAYPLVVKELLECFRVKPALMNKYVDRTLLYGIGYYDLEAVCLSSLISVLDDTPSTLSQRALLLGEIPAHWKLDIAEPESFTAANLLDLTVSSLISGWQYWLQLQKVLSQTLCDILSTHRRLLLDRVSSQSSAEVVLDSFELRDKLDLYLNTVYACIDDGDAADLPVLLQFTAQCEELPLLKLAALVSNVGPMLIASPQLKQAYYRLVHRLAVTICTLSSLPTAIIKDSASFKDLSASQEHDCIYSDTIDEVLDYLGFTIDVVLSNFIAGLPFCTLDVDAYDGIEVAPLCPLASELESGATTSSSTHPPVSRLTAAARALRIDLFRRFSVIWRERCNRDSFDLDSLINTPHFSTSFKLLSPIYRRTYHLDKLRALPSPSIRNEYILPPYISSCLSKEVILFLQSNDISVRLYDSTVSGPLAMGTQLLREVVTLELARTYLKDAIGIEMGNDEGSDYVLLTKLYCVHTAEHTKYTSHAHQILVKYAKTELKKPPSARDLTRHPEDQLKLIAAMTLAEFADGRVFSVTSSYLPEAVEGASQLHTSQRIVPTSAVAPLHSSSREALAPQVGQKRRATLSNIGAHNRENKSPQKHPPLPTKRSLRQYLDSPDSLDLYTSDSSNTIIKRPSAPGTSSKKHK